MMSGRNIHDSAIVYDPSRRVGAGAALEVRNLRYGDILKDVSFTVRRGEIFGVTGLVGAGKTELLKCVYGLYETDGGQVKVGGEIGKGTVSRRGGKRKRIASDSFVFGFVPEDRKREGLFLDLSLVLNISISSLRHLSKLSYVNRRKEIELAARSVEDLDIKTSGLAQQVKFLSGGNQQKVILSRWLSSKKTVLLMDEPTRGVDVMAKTEIYRLMNKLSGEGISIVFSSSDLSEVLSISDRVAVMRNGRVVSVFERKDFDKETILRDVLMD
jgi:ABC-type sugar transport system ATPase subunit